MNTVAIPVLHTRRLVLRAMTGDDLDGYEGLYTDERVYRWFGGDAPDRAQVWRSVAMHLGHWALRGYGQWALEEKATGTLVGRAGLWNPEGWPGLEVGSSASRGPRMQHRAESWRSWGWLTTAPSTSWASTRSCTA